MISRLPAIVLGVIACVCLLPGVGHAQGASSTRGSGMMSRPVIDPAPRSSRQTGGRSNAVATGALIGAGAALGATAWAAATYGNNEGGGFCGACMAKWSLITVPIGAGIGAAIGYPIQRARRSVTAVPVFSRKSAGLVVSARF